MRFRSRRNRSTRSSASSSVSQPSSEAFCPELREHRRSGVVPMEHNWFFPPHDGIRLGDLAVALGAELADAAHADRIVRSVSPVNRAKDGDICYILSRKMKAELETSQGAAILCDAALASLVPAHIAVLLSRRPHTAFALAGAMLHPSAMRPEMMTSTASGVAPGAYVDPEARIEPGVVI